MLRGMKKGRNLRESDRGGSLSPEKSSRCHVTDNAYIDVWTE